MKWVVLGIAVCLLLVGCHKLAKQNHIEYFEERGCPCECIK